MGQAEVYELLEKVGKPLSLTEITKLLEDDKIKISKDINKMIKYREVNYIEIDRVEALIKYKSKRRLRLFYVKKN